MKKNKAQPYQTAIVCPCCKEKLIITISPANTDFLIERKEQTQKQIEDALKKNGIEIASMNGGE